MGEKATATTWNSSLGWVEVGTRPFSPEPDRSLLPSRLFLSLPFKFKREPPDFLAPSDLAQALLYGRAELILVHFTKEFL